MLCIGFLFPTDDEECSEQEVSILVFLPLMFIQTRYYKYSILLLQSNLQAITAIRSEPYTHKTDIKHYTYTAELAKRSIAVYGNLNFYTYSFHSWILLCSNSLSLILWSTLVLKSAVLTIIFFKSFSVFQLTYEPL